MPNNSWVLQGKQFYNNLMQKRLDKNDILMYLTHTENKSIVTERLIRTLISKICKKSQLIIKKSYLGYLNKLVYEYKNTYHYSIGKNPIHADCSALTEEIESSDKAPKSKVGERVRFTKYKSIFSKVCTKDWSKEIFVIYCELKTDPWKLL